MSPDTPVAPADAAAPRVEVSRLKGGERMWKIVATTDTDEAALDATRSLF